MYVVTVEFDVRAEMAPAFRAAMIANATASRRDEPGCRQFDVCADPAEPASIFLYELYDDRAAFDAHLASDHFRRFDEETRDWIAGKAVRLFERVDP